MNEITNWVASNNTSWTYVVLPTSAALAAVALVGYVFGQRTRKASPTSGDGRRQKELERAERIAWQLETIAGRLRQDLVAHHSQVESFKQRLRLAQTDGSEQTWKQLCDEAETVLGPTMQLAQHLSHAYDEIRQQSDALETFTGGRTDPHTGVGNGRALEGQLQVLLSANSGTPSEFVVAIVSLDRESGTGANKSAPSNTLLMQMAGVIRACMRDTDFVARFGDEEFVVVMPQTSLAGGCVFGDRFRERVAIELGATVSCGIAEVAVDDDAKSLLARADSALYSAKASGPNRIFLHTGAQIREHHSSAKCASKTANAARTGQPPAAKEEPATVGDLIGATTNENWSDAQ